MIWLTSCWNAECWRPGPQTGTQHMRQPKINVADMRIDPYFKFYFIFCPLLLTWLWPFFSFFCVCVCVYAYACVGAVKAGSCICCSCCGYCSTVSGCCHRWTWSHCPACCWMSTTETPLHSQIVPGRKRLLSNIYFSAPLLKVQYLGFTALRGNICRIPQKLPKDKKCCLFIILEWAFYINRGNRFSSRSPPCCTAMFVK